MMQSWPKETSPFHEGERSLQEQAGVRERLEMVGRRVIYDQMPVEHQRFYQQLPFLVVAGLDQNSWPIPSVVFGTPGFVQAPTSKELIIHTRFLEEDPLFNTLQPGDSIGILGIEPPTRRRNRMNGVITDRYLAQLSVTVSQAFGNCPQYIEACEFEIIGDTKAPTSTGTVTFNVLDEDTTHLIRQSHRFFVASHNDRDDHRETGGLDVSHRGGLPGFIKVEGNTLTIPDFRGNFAFNTLGNFSIKSSGGLLFLDDRTRDIVQLWGNAELIMERTDELKSVPGAQRGWKFHVLRGLRHLRASPLTWSEGEPGPGAERSGIWPENHGLV